MPILTAEERVGTTIGGRYRLERVLGRGGMATVLEATHTINGRRVAVKLLNPELSTDAGVVGRFVQEARASAALEHPNVVSVLDTGQDADGTPFLVLELLRGETLSSLLARQGRLSIEQTLFIALPMLEALAAAHALGIVHRDIKPDNVFLAQDATGRMIPKLLDFGIARVVEGSRTQTATGVALGTPYYMSPEQVEAPSSVGPASDIWSMGVVLYQCLTGTLPFQGATASGVLVAIMTTPPPAISTRGVALPPQLAAAIDRALARAPAARFASARELAAALVAGAAAGDAAVPSGASPKSNRGLIAVVLVLALLVSAGAAVLVFLALKDGFGPHIEDGEAVRPVVVLPEAGPQPALDSGAVASAAPDANGPTDAGLAVAPTDGAVLAAAPTDAGAAIDGAAYAMLQGMFADGAVPAFGLPPGITLPPGVHMPTPGEMQAAIAAMERLERMQQEQAAHGHGHGTTHEQVPDSPVLQAAHACPHGDDDCVIAAIRGHAESEAELSTLIEAYRRSDRLYQAVVPLRRYGEMYPDGPHAAEYARLFVQASADPRHRNGPR